MKKLNYHQLMDFKPNNIGSVINQLGQVITFVEHPLLGDEYPVIAVFHEFEMAVNTEFFDMDDMYPGSEYLPVYRDGEVKCAWDFGL